MSMAKQEQVRTTEHFMENGTKEITIDTKTLIVRSFAQAGPWALLALILVGAGMWETHYFVSQYVATTADHISTANQILAKISDNQLMLTDVAKSNAALTSSNAKILAELSDLMTAANRNMAGSVEERREQTRILREILKESQEHEP